MTEPNYLDLAAVADILGVSYDSVRTYHTRAKRNRRRGHTRPGDLPPPDATFGRSPVWLRDTISGWDRPGRGAGGGRPWGA